MRKNLTDLAGVCVLECDKYSDDRGFFIESYSAHKLAELGITTEFVQDNHSLSNAHVIRGLHFQAGIGQVKLVRCTRGKVLDVVVDVRPDSPTFKKWIGVELSPDLNNMIFIPGQYAHGFAVLEGPAEIQYKCSTFYDPPNEKTLRYNDPDLGIIWPIQNPIISDRDKVGQTLEELCKYL